MNKTLRSILLWLLTILVAGSAMIYQTLTGPTKPIRDTITVVDKEVKIKLPRTAEIEPGKEFFDIEIENVDQAISGTYQYKRFKSYDDWTTEELTRIDNSLFLHVPQLDTAGKMEYQITLVYNDKSVILTEEPVIMRYKGKVNKVFVLFPHIFFMVMAMLFSTRTGIEAIRKGKYTLRFAAITVVLLTLGGLVLGPIMQKQAFGAYWTGWPFGGDLTDNKTITAWLFWFLAYFMIRKENKKWIFPILASIIFIGINMIPHSTLGSEIDYTQIEEAPVEITVEETITNDDTINVMEEDTTMEKAIH